MSRIQPRAPRLYMIPTLEAQSKQVGPTWTYFGLLGAPRIRLPNPDRPQHFEQAPVMKVCGHMPPAESWSREGA